MKFNKNNLPLFIQIFSLSAIVGTLSWAIIAIILLRIGIDLSFVAGTIGFDVYIVSCVVRLNPGTLAGIAAGSFICAKLQ
ncbi:MAG: hypothetical protein JXB03_13045 [Spirochaetales bacterium]|nr:hypothetical protein [Spirochaetales bacterium]